MLGVIEKTATVKHTPDGEYPAANWRSEIDKSKSIDDTAIVRLSKMISLAMTCQLQSAVLRSIDRYQSFWIYYLEDQSSTSGRKMRR